MAMKPVERARMREFLVDRFSLGELEDLAFDLCVDADLLPSGTKLEFARELIAYCERRGTLDCLWAEVLRQRPERTKPIVPKGSAEDLSSLLKDAQEAVGEGRRLLRLRSGPRCENLEKAIERFKSAIDVYEHCNLREDRAAALNDLAQVYEVCPCGDLSCNQEKAIGLYLEAQRAYSRDDHPCEWATIEFNLGNAYLRRIEEEREDNHRRAESCYKEALSVVSEKCSPYQWARVCNSLGVYYLETVIGNRADNLEEARDHLERALEVFQSGGHVVDWVDAQNNLGTVWRYRIEGSRADNLEASIRCYEAALRVLDPVRDQHLWGDVHHNLGLSYSGRVEGIRAHNLRKARENLSAALQARKSAGLTAKMIQTDCQMLILGITGQLGNQAEWIERVIKELGDHEQTLAKQSSQLEQAKVQLGLGNAYLMRVRGDRVRNIEAAIEWFEKASGVIKVSNAPAEWSYIQNGLTAAYCECPIHDRLENLDKAINGLQQSDLDTLLEKGWRSEWAKMQNNLAGAYWNRGRYHRDGPVENEKADADFRQAIAHAQEALEVYAQDEYPFEWALSKYIIGNALSDLTTKEDRAARLRRATQHFQAALEVFTDRTYPLQRAWALNDYGVTLLNLAWVSPEQLNLRDLKNAVQLFKKAIKTHEASGLRTERLRSMVNLGSLYYFLGLWNEAYKELDQAVQVIETLRADALGEPGHVHIAEQYTRAYQYLADTCVRRGKRFWRDALERVEASKGRAFLAEMGTDDYPVPTSLPVTLKDEEAVLLKSLRETEAKLRSLGTTPLAEPQDRQERKVLLRRQEQLTAAYDTLLREIEPQAPEYVALRRGNPTTYTALQSLLDQAEREIGVVELFPTQGRLLVFVMRSHQRSPVVIPVDLDEETLRSTYLEPFKRVLRGRRTRAWMGDLGDRLFSEALTYLTGVDLVYLIPTGPLHALPLHALSVNNRTLIGRFPIAYAPSLTILSRVMARARHRGCEDAKGILVVGDPTGWPEYDLSPLKNAETVTRAVAGRFGVEPLLLDEEAKRDPATKQEILDKLRVARAVFFACHGCFNSQIPLNSGLYLTRTGNGRELDKLLTIREIMQEQLSADLVVLSACQSGLSDIKRGDELTGLARAFLYAGASTVIVALWSLNEAPAARLMDDFFGNLYPDGTKKAQTATVLRESCLSLLRDGYLDFFDWAPFIVVGDWK
jgi:CHAT domain-containing protein/tetratricopeptide (TPR) repeat protein